MAVNDWRIVVMGVSGCGKSSVGIALAEALGARFIDGDDLHPEANKAKMGAGIPLDDSDRWPWLDLVGQALAEEVSEISGHAFSGTVITNPVLCALGWQPRNSRAPPRCPHRPLHAGHPARLTVGNP